MFIRTLALCGSPFCPLAFRPRSPLLESASLLTESAIAEHTRACTAMTAALSDRDLALHTILRDPKVCGNMYKICYCMTYCTESHPDPPPSATPTTTTLSLCPATSLPLDREVEVDDSVGLCVTRNENSVPSISRNFVDGCSSSGPTLASSALSHSGAVPPPPYSISPREAVCISSLLLAHIAHAFGARTQTTLNDGKSPHHFYILIIQPRRHPSPQGGGHTSGKGQSCRKAGSVGGRLRGQLEGAIPAGWSVCLYHHTYSIDEDGGRGYDR